jgi:hypothetical protein
VPCLLQLLQFVTFFIIHLYAVHKVPYRVAAPGPVKLCGPFVAPAPLIQLQELRRAGLAVRNRGT